MKRIMVLTAALGLLLPNLATAQTDQPAAQPAAPFKPGPKPARPGPGRPNPGAGPARPPGPPATPPAARPPGTRPPPSGRPPSAGRPGHGGPPTYVRPLPPRGNQFWHRGRYYGRIPGPAFTYPPGWRYRTWNIGTRLPPLFLAPSYFYQGWATLGLQQPPPGYAWVRFGPDLLLVNLRTNEVEDAVYGVFL